MHATHHEFAGLRVTALNNPVNFRVGRSGHTRLKRESWYLLMSARVVKLMALLLVVEPRQNASGKRSCHGGRGNVQCARAGSCIHPSLGWDSVRLESLISLVEASR